MKVTTSFKRFESEVNKILSTANVIKSVQNFDPGLQLKSLAIRVLIASYSTIVTCSLLRQSIYASRLTYDHYNSLAYKHYVKAVDQC